MSDRDSVSITKEDSRLESFSQHEGGISKPDFSSKSIKHYFKTRVTELLPSKEHIEQNKNLLNPIPGLKLVSGGQWLLITVAFSAWAWDAFGFFAVSLNVSRIAEDFDKSVKDITWGITLVLMLRSVGAFLFGYLGDKYGRKWPFVLNLSLMCVLEIGSGFVKNYQQFLLVRAIYGILLGGVFGAAAATCLDDCPAEARGFISGFLQQGYTFGYLMAVVFTRAIADNTSKTWRALFWFGAGVGSLIICARIYLPETSAFQRQKEIERYNTEHGIYQKSFKEKAIDSLKIYWLIIIYLVILMAGFNFMSHGSQDLYPTLLTKQYDFSSNSSTVTNCVANLGAITGCITIGHLSNFVGRRLSIMICCVCGGAIIYPWAFIKGSGINAGAFFLQFFVFGAWGVIPIHLSELAPPDFRSFVVGSAYQLGNLASSASSTIEATIGESFPLEGKPGIFDYAKVMAIFVGCVFSYVLLVTLVGPENKMGSFTSEDANEELALYEQAKYEEEIEIKGEAIHIEGTGTFDNSVSK